MKKRILYKKHYKTWHFLSVYYLCDLKEKNKQTNTHFEILGYFSQQIFQKLLVTNRGKPISRQKRRTAARVSVVIFFRSSVV